MRALTLSSVLAAIFLTASGIADDAHAQMGGDVRVRPPPCSGAALCATVFMEDGLYGVRNGAREVTIPPRFRRAERARARFPGAHGLILTYDENGRMGFVGRDGRELAPPQFTSPTSGDGVIFVSIAGAQRSRCAFDLSGRQVLPCEFSNIFSSDRGLMAVRGSELLWYSHTGVSTPQMAAAPAAQSAAAPRPAQSAAAPAYNRVHALAHGRNWDEALSLALRESRADLAHALLAFYHNGGVTDTRYGPMVRLIISNRRIFDDARANATPEQRRQLTQMQEAFNAYELRLAQGPGPAPSGSGYVSGARTVSDCHQAGGSVSAMGYCRR